MAKMKESIPYNSLSAHNVLAAGSTLIGEIRADEDFRIDGNIDGNLFCKGKIIVGPSSCIKGNIECANIEISGKLIGDIHCTNTIVLRASAIFEGNIKTLTIEIEPNAKFTGTCAMLTEKDSVVIL